MRVLVADDDRVVSHLLCSVLRARGHEVRAALDFPQTQAAAVLDPRPEVIVLDLNMPGAVGLEGLVALRGDPETQNIPIIAISGTMDAPLEAEARALGARDVLVKPISPATLAASLEKLSGS